MLFSFAICSRLPVVLFFFSVNDDSVERKQNKWRCTRSPYFVTRARAKARGKGEKEKKRREKKKEEKERYLRGRRVAMIYENKSIETRSLCVVMLLLRWGEEEEVEEEEEEREKEKRRKWQCSLLVEAKVLYEKSRFHRLMLLMIMMFSREKEKNRKKD